MEHLPYRALEEGHPPGVPRTVPGVGAVRGVVGQGTKEGRGQGIEVVARLAHNVTGDELRGVLEHVDEAVQLPQYVIGDMAGGAGLAVEEDRDVGVAEADLLHEGAQLGYGRGGVLRQGELLVVDGQDEGRGAGLLLGEGGHVAEAGHPQDLDPLLLDRLGQDPDPGPAGILGAEVLIDDDHWEAKAHGALLGAW